MGANRVDANRTGLFTPRCQLMMPSVSAPGAPLVPLVEKNRTGEHIL